MIGWTSRLPLYEEPKFATCPLGRVTGPLDSTEKYPSAGDPSSFTTVICNGAGNAKSTTAEPFASSTVSDIRRRCRRGG